MSVRTRLSNQFGRLTRWMAPRNEAVVSDDVAAGPPEGGTKDRATNARVAALCICILLSGLGVRVLHWQDSHVEIVASKTSLMGVFDRYRKEARRMLDEGGILFPVQPPQRGDARMLAHPPGYSMLLAAIYRISGNPYGILWIVQILCDAAAAVVVFLIAFELVNVSIAFTAGTLVALCPQLAHYSLVFAPDTLAVLPILISIYLIVLSMKRPRVAYLALAGALIGVSCWLKANALALAPFIGLLIIPFVFEKGRRMRYSLTFIGAALLAVAPITIRNYIVFHRLIPLSIQAGLSLSEGIGSFDPEGKLGMPRSDREARFKDAEWAGRPDYAPSLWVPDGIERDQERLARGLKIVRDRPFWFLGIMLRRAAFMLRYNDSRLYGWPADTSVVSRVSTEAPFSHASLLYSEETLEVDRAHSVLVVNGGLMDTPMATTNVGTSAWSRSAADLLSDGEQIARKAAVTLDGAGQVLTIAGDDSEWGDQFASPPIAVEKSTDYILLLDLDGASGPTAMKITDRATKTTLAVANTSEVVNSASAANNSGQAFRVPPSGGVNSFVNADDKDAFPSPTSPGIQLQAPFATGRNTEIRVVFSNNGPGPRPATLSLAAVRLITVGRTADTWTRYPRSLVRGFQGILFNTWRMLAMILAGAIIWALSRQWRALAVVLAVPVYYLAAQSWLTTEYRYILAIHYFVFILAAVTLCTAASWCYQAALRLSHRIQTSGAAST